MVMVLARGFDRSWVRVDGKMKESLHGGYRDERYFSGDGKMRKQMDRR